METLGKGLLYRSGEDDGRSLLSRLYYTILLAQFRMIIQLEKIIYKWSLQWKFF